MLRRLLAYAKSLCLPPSKMSAVEQKENVRAGPGRDEGGGVGGAAARGDWAAPRNAPFARPGARPSWAQRGNSPRPHMTARRLRGAPPRVVAN